MTKDELTAYQLAADLLMVLADKLSDADLLGHEWSQRAYNVLMDITDYLQQEEDRPHAGL